MSFIRFSRFFKIHLIASDWPHNNYNSRCWLTFPGTSLTSCRILRESSLNQPSLETVFPPWTWIVLQLGKRDDLWTFVCSFSVTYLPLTSPSTYLSLSLETLLQLLQSFFLINPMWILIFTMKDLASVFFGTQLFCDGLGKRVSQIKNWGKYCFYLTPLRDSQQVLKVQL